MGSVSAPALVVILILWICQSANPAFSAVLGDVDGDGRVTLRDVTLALRMASLGTGSAKSWARADVSPLPGADGRTFGDGAVTPDDVRAILRLALAGDPLPAGQLVVTLAGDGTVASGGTGPTDPYDLALSPSGDLFIAEASGHRIDRLTTDGHLVKYCGSGRRGFRDGSSHEACFNGPYGIALAEDGSLFVADRFNHSVRRIDRNGRVTTVAGTGRPGFRDGPGAVAEFNEPQGLRLDSRGVLWVADSSNHRIRRIDRNGVVTTAAGDGRPGFLDGPALRARFFSPSGVLPDPIDGSLWIADTYNHAVRRLLPEGRVVTVGGDGRPGWRDGPLAQARFSRPFGFARDAFGRLYVADWGNAAVRRIDPDGTVRTVAGDGSEGFRDGPALSAQLHGLMNVEAGPDGRIYLADTDNERVRVVLP